VAEWRGLVPGTILREVATPGLVWKDCTVVRSEAVGLVFQVDRAVTDEGGDVENVRSTVLVPWTSVSHVVVEEERSG
jgi:hypothetical protein